MIYLKLDLAKILEWDERETNPLADFPSNQFLRLMHNAMGFRLQFKSWNSICAFVKTCFQTGQTHQCKQKWTDMSNVLIVIQY